MSRLLPPSSSGVLLVDLRNDLDLSSSFSFSISDRLSASARLSTAIAKKTFRRMSMTHGLRSGQQHVYSGMLRFV